MSLLSPINATRLTFAEIMNVRGGNLRSVTDHFPTATTFAETSSALYRHGGTAHPENPRHLQRGARLRNGVILRDGTIPLRDETINPDIGELIHHLYTGTATWHISRSGHASGDCCSNRPPYSETFFRH